jgi:hypothetical protein
VFQIKIVEKNKIQILCPVTFFFFFFFENRVAYDIMSKNMVELEAADDNMAARCMLD